MNMTTLFDKLENELELGRLKMIKKDRIRN